MVTGATGFIGRAMVTTARQRGYAVREWDRREEGLDLASCHSPAALARWSNALTDVDTVIHLAGIAHRLDGNTGADIYDLINSDATEMLARAAHQAGVRRFIFVSTAKVFGEGDDGPYSHTSPPRPQDAYARSKWAAEKRLLALAANAALEVVIVRPPLVYGATAEANFGQLLKLAGLPLPLPFAGVHNRRSMIGLDNLVDFILHCIDSERAANAAWECADPKPYSLADMVTIARASQGSARRQFWVPQSWLALLVRTLLGRGSESRLFGDFLLLTQHTEHELDWVAPYTMQEILRGHQPA